MTSPRVRTLSGVAALVAAAALLAACGGSSAEDSSGAAAPAASSGSSSAPMLLDAQRLTILDQPIKYPTKKPAQISSTIVVLEPGQETGWHEHKTPLYVYVLEGTVTVDYDAGVTKQYPAGTAFMEAQGVPHNGTNKGDTVVRILTVSMGAKGIKNTVARKQ